MSRAGIHYMSKARGCMSRVAVATARPERLAPLSGAVHAQQASPCLRYPSRSPWRRPPPVPTSL
eukprot:scaffold128190_cov48-Phaeocystis_antarctica.AAC.3